MDWLNLHTSVLDSPECLRCDPVRRATWIWLLRYCIGQENGGVIEDCRDWGDTTWQQLCRVKLEEVDATSLLWFFDGKNLVVKHYPVEKEQEVKRNRVNGKAGGQARTQAKTQAARVNGAKHNPSENPTEGKGREEEGKGKDGATTTSLMFEGMDADETPIELAKAAPMEINWRDWRSHHALIKVAFNGEDGCSADWERLFGRYTIRSLDAMYARLQEATPGKLIYYGAALAWLESKTPKAQEAQ